MTTPTDAPARAVKVTVTVIVNPVLARRQQASLQAAWEKYGPKPTDPAREGVQQAQQKPA